MAFAALVAVQFRKLGKAGPKAARAPEGSAMTLYLVRHGDKEPGIFRRAGFPHNDQPLSDTGLLEAGRLRGYFRWRRIESVYVSEYSRTLQTVEGICEDQGISPLTTGLLNEIDTGAFEFGAPEDLALRYPEIWREYDKPGHRTDFRYPEGESGEDVFARIDAFFSLMEKEGKDCLAAAHDGWIRLALCRVLGLPASSRFFFSVDTCGIAELERNRDGWKIIRFNHYLE